MPAHILFIAERKKERRTAEDKLRRPTLSRIAKSQETQGMESSGKRSNYGPKTPQRGSVSLLRWICRRTSVSLTEGCIQIRKRGKRHRCISHGAEVQCVGEEGAKEWGMMVPIPNKLMQDRGISAGAWPGHRFLDRTLFSFCALKCTLLYAKKYGR